MSFPEKKQKRTVRVTLTRRFVRSPVSETGYQRRLTQDAASGRCLLHWPALTCN